MGAITPILYQGAMPVFAYVGPDTGDLTATTVEARLTERTRAVMVTYLLRTPRRDGCRPGGAGRPGHPDHRGLGPGLRGLDGRTAGRDDRPVGLLQPRTWTARLADGVRPGDRVVFDDTYARIVTEHDVHQRGHDLTAATPVRPPEPFGDSVWNAERDAIGACLLDELGEDGVIEGDGRTWIVVAVPGSCWSTERVLEAVDRTRRTVMERTHLDGPAALLLVE